MTDKTTENIIDKITEIIWISLWSGILLFVLTIVGGNFKAVVMSNYSMQTKSGTYHSMSVKEENSCVSFDTTRGNIPTTVCGYYVIQNIPKK